MKKTKLINIIAIVIALAIIAAAVYAVVTLTGCKDDIRDLINPTFRVVVNNTSYTGMDNLITIPKNGQLKFYAKNGGDCSIVIQPNVTADTDFSYTADGETYLFSTVDSKELTNIFLDTSNIYGDYFVLKSNENFTLKKVLSTYHDGAEIELNGKTEYPFQLVITSEEGESIGFGVCFYSLTNVVIDPDTIVF
jgi:hypothetical protein